MIDEVINGELRLKRLKMIDEVINGELRVKFNGEKET